MAMSSRSRGKIVRGYTRRSGVYGRFNTPISRAPEKKYFDVTYAEAAPSAAPPNPVRVGAVGLGNRPTFLDVSRIWRDWSPPGAPGPVGALGHLLQIDQGAGPSQRIGRKLMVRSMEIKGRIQLLPVATGNFVTDDACEETHHLWVLLDTQVNGVQAVPTALLQQAPEAAAAVADSLAFNSIPNSSRFRVLKHIVTRLQRANVNNGATFSGITRDLHCFLKLNVPIEYSNELPYGQISQLRDNGIFMMSSVSTSALATAQTAVATLCFEHYHIRFRYTDV